MTAWNYIGWAWIVWTLFNEGFAMMRPTRTYTEANPLAGFLSWVFSGLAIWAAVS